MITLSISVLTSFSQSPKAFKYQAVVRNNSGEVITNQNVYVVIKILEDSENGNVVFEETHSVQSNQFGLIVLSVGKGTNVSGNLSSISWGQNDFFVRLEMDITGGLSPVFIGTSQLLTVPYALYADEAGNVDDADADPTNEIQDISLSGTNLSISNGSSVDLSGLQDGYEANTDAQTLSISGNDLSITGGNTVTLPDSVIDDDADPSNEIQDISLSGTELSISGGSTIDLNVIQDGYEANTDAQTLSLVNHQLSISNGNMITLPDSVIDDDADPTNEFQDISLSGNDLSITNGNTITLPFSEDTDTTNELISSGILIGNILTIYEANDTIEVDLSAISSSASLSIVLTEGNDAGSQRIVNLAAPVSNNDAATKAYVDSMVQLIKNDNNSVLVNQGSFVDWRDGQQYDIVLIGSAIWTAENMNYSTDSSWYYNENAVYDTSGLLYNWEDAQIACPDGWRLPTDQDWWDLELALGMDSAYMHIDSVGWRANGVGTDLKQTGSSGFEAQLAGHRNPNGTFSNVTDYARFWVADEYDATLAWRRSLYTISSSIRRDYITKDYGNSVRCVKE